MLFQTMEAQILYVYFLRLPYNRISFTVPPNTVVTVDMMCTFIDAALLISPTSLFTS